MSEPKRANFITVDTAKRANNNLVKTVRLAIDLIESNENEYPEFNYKELVRAEENKCKELRRNDSTNGKPSSNHFDSFSDNDEDVKRIAKQFEQKYGSSGNYSRTKRRSKRDDYADIGAGYDENDSFIDNTDGYDEQMPPEVDTLHRGFYINSGSLEFMNVPENNLSQSDNETPHRRPNKRQITSSSSSDESSESSVEESDSHDRGEPPPKEDGLVNGVVSDSKPTDNEKQVKTDKGLEKKRHKRRRQEVPNGVTLADVPAIRKSTEENKSTEGRQGDNEMSTDSRTSDSMISKPAPSSDNAVTSDSSRDAVLPAPLALEIQPPPPISVPVSPGPVVLPGAIVTLLANFQASVRQMRQISQPAPAKELEQLVGGVLARLHKALQTCQADENVQRTALTDVAKEVGLSVNVLQLRLKRLSEGRNSQAGSSVGLTDQDRQTIVLTVMMRLKEIIESMKPTIVNSYNVECQRVQDANKKIVTQNEFLEDDKRIPERRLPKRKFPWNNEVRSLLSDLVRCSDDEASAAMFLRSKVLPLFPTGFVRLPTLLQQASLNKDQKVPSEGRKPKIFLKQQMANTKFPREAVATANHQNQKMQESENVTPVVDKLGSEMVRNEKQDSNPLNSILCSLNLPSNTQVTIEKAKPTGKDEKARTANLDIVSIEKTAKSSTSSVSIPTSTEKKSDGAEKYVPPNNIGSITITAVPPAKTHTGRASSNAVTMMPNVPSEPQYIRVRSPSSLLKTSDHHQAEKSSIRTIASGQSKAHDKTKHSQSTKSGLSEYNSKDSNRNSDGVSITKSDVTKTTITGLPLQVSVRQNPTDLTKKMSHPKLAPDAKSGKHDEKIRESKHPSSSDNFRVPSTDRRKVDSRKMVDDGVVIMSDVDPLAEVLSLDDSSSDVELVEEVRPQLPRPRLHPVKASEKQANSIAKTTLPQILDIAIKNDSIEPPTNGPKQSKKDKDGFCEPNPKKAKVENQVSVVKVNSVAQSKGGMVNSVQRVDSSSVKKSADLYSGSVGKSGSTKGAERAERAECATGLSEMADIDKVMQDLRDLQNSQEMQFKSDSDSYYPSLDCNPKIHEPFPAHKLSDVFKQPNLVSNDESTDTLEKPSGQSVSPG